MLSHLWDNFLSFKTREFCLFDVNCKIDRLSNPGDFVTVFTPNKKISDCWIWRNRDAIATSVFSPQPPLPENPYFSFPLESCIVLRSLSIQAYLVEYLQISHLWLISHHILKKEICTFRFYYTSPFIRTVWFFSWLNQL